MQEDIFYIKYDEQSHIVYAPLRYAAAVVPDVYLGQPIGDGADNALSTLLKEQGFFDNPPIDMVATEEAAAFKPCEVTLFLTTRCSLRCTYCYASAGHADTSMSFEIGKSAIDLIVNNAQELERTPTLNFHGAGEPTQNWPLLTRLTEYFKEIAPQGFVFAATNGIINREQAQFIAEHFTAVNLSFDGPESVQNAQRPCPDGSASYGIIAAVARYFDECGFPYTIRSTITASSVDALPDIARYFIDNHPMCGTLSFEPVYISGRAIDTGEVPVDPQTFIDKYRQARDIVKAAGKHISYSGERVLQISECFCGVAGRTFTVTPEGLATACFDVSMPDDPRRDLFCYGEYVDGAFVFNDERLRHLRTFTVYNRPFCTDCFAKWHCAGDCIIKTYAYLDDPDRESAYRCAINRALTADIIRGMVANT